MRAATLDFIAEKTTYIFVDPSGIGKTISPVRSSARVFTRPPRQCTTVADLVNALVAGQAKSTLQRWLDTHLRNPGALAR